MSCVCFFLRRLCSLALIAIVPVTALFGHHNEKEKAKQLEALATNASGVLADIPEEIRAFRSGPVTQRVTISDDGILTLSRWFQCTPPPEVGSQRTLMKARSEKRIALADFKDNPVFRYELNRHSNTIQLFDKDCLWCLGFPSTSDAERAFALLGSLIATAPSAPQPVPFSRAAAASEAGYQYLVVSARCEEVGDGLRLLSASEPSPRLLCWLTKSSPEETENLFHESMNRLPLFLFDLSVLDGCSFFTQSIPGNTAFLPCSIGVGMMQSVACTDQDGFEACLKYSPFVGIHLTSMPDFPPPVAILCKASDEHTIRKTAHDLKMHLKEAHLYLTTAADAVDGATRGVTSSWITGLSDNSYDILRFCLLHKELTLTLFSYTIYPEFPSLKHLLRMKSRYNKDLTVEEMICRTSHAMEGQARTLTEFQGRVLRLALATAELGGAFGDDADLGYNSWPLALAIAEKAGVTEQEKTALQSLIEDPEAEPSKKGEKKTATESVFLAFVQESRTASKIGICLREWLVLKSRFYAILSKLGKLPALRQGNALRVKALQDSYAAIVPFGIPKGALFCKGPLPTRSICSSYLWELRDPLHRDGLSLKRRREKFEHLIIESGKTSLKGRFWEWLNKELQDEPLCSNVYLQDSERENYRALFEGAVLVAPKIPQGDEIEMIYVIDDHGRMYVGQKKDGVTSHDKGLIHASLSGGRPVAAAGKLVCKDGKIVEISDHCGQYRCGPYGLEVTLSVLEKMGVPLDQVKGASKTP